MPTPLARTGRRAWRCYRPTWGTPARTTRNGTCQHPPSCSPWPGSASRLTWPASHDRARTYPASVLHRPAGPPAPRQPAHHRRLPCDTWRLQVAFASGQGEKQPCQLDLNDLDAPLIGAFLDHLERERGNSPRTRNARLAAICSLFRYAALRHPEHAEVIARVLAIPPKRYDKALVTYGDRHEHSRSDARICGPTPPSGPA